MESYGKFCPTIYTPILNLLYFLLRESDTTYNGRYQQRDRINEELVRTKKLDRDLSEDELNHILDELDQSVHAETQSHPIRKQVNQRFESEKKQQPKEEDVLFKTPEDMETFLYGHLTLDQFDALKKLKALTQSSNLNESTLAFRKGKELSQKYGVDWERVPCYNTRKK